MKHTPWGKSQLITPTKDPEARPVRLSILVDDQWYCRDYGDAEQAFALLVQLQQEYDVPAWCVTMMDVAVRKECA